MLVDGLCSNGHTLLCVMSAGKIRGTFARGALRATCPHCGGEVVDAPESATMPVQSTFRPRAKSGTNEA
jgi:hypothetical protein